MSLIAITEKAMQNIPLTRQEALSILETPDSDLLVLLNAALKVREKNFGRKVKCCMLINAQSGNCSEDCSYCSQSKVSKALIEKYRLVDTDKMVAGSTRNRENRTCNYAIVTSGRGPTDAMVDKICDAISEIRHNEPELEVCASLGILKPGQAEKLKNAGLHRYHHNINTSPGHHDSIVSTHRFEDRLDTVRQARESGLSVCCGVIVGMGETKDDVVDMAFTLRELAVDSIPINFLAPVEGTPLEKQRDLTPAYCLKVLAMFRMACPEMEIRLAGGREINLRSLQPLALYAANAMFVGDYLTMGGQGASTDHQMIADMGFEIDF